MTGMAKADLEHLWWVDDVTNDPAWVRRVGRLRMLPVLIPYALLGFNAAMLVVGVTVAVVSRLDDPAEVSQKVFVGIVDCVAGGTLDFDITVFNRTEVVASVEVDASQGCFGTGATVRSEP